MEEGVEQIICRVPECERLVPAGEVLEVCATHGELMDVQGKLDEWELVRDILVPWTESAKLINAYLAQAMHGALSEAELRMEALEERAQHLRAELTHSR